VGQRPFVFVAVQQPACYFRKKQFKWVGAGTTVGVMPPKLAKAPVGFLSYAHLDDQASDGWISRLREKLALAVSVVIGEHFEIFQDRADVGWGQHWPDRLDEALRQARFLFPILTPTYFKSEMCDAELKRFLQLERRAGRKDLILPIYLITDHRFDERADRRLVNLSRRQHRDWRDHWQKSFSSPKIKKEIGELAREVKLAINRSEPTATNVSIPIDHEDYIPDDIRTFRLRYGNVKDLKRFQQIAESYLNSESILPDEQVKIWFRTNKTFCRLVEYSINAENQRHRWHVCGYYAILPLKREIYDLLKKGKLTDLDISADHFADLPSDRQSALYILEIVVDKKDQSCSIAANVIVRDMVWYVDRMIEEYGSIFEVGALIATDHGGGLAKKMGFQIVKDYKIGSNKWIFYTITKSQFAKSKQRGKIALLTKNNNFRDVYTIV
jgi:hypothetical protein